MTSIYFILDKSGSMHACLNDTIGGFNAFIEKQKIDNPNGTMSLILFNDEIVTAYKHKPIYEVEPLTPKIYFPSGATALLDAIGSTIKMATGTSAAVSVVILTDGEENASKKYSKIHVNDLIESRRDAWSFVFLGANQDAIKEARNLGIPERGAMTFTQNNTRAVFESLSDAFTRQATCDDVTISFTDAERSRSQVQCELDNIMC
jgi:uncharacterized protein YegL